MLARWARGVLGCFVFCPPRPPTYHVGECGEPEFYVAEPKCCAEECCACYCCACAWRAMCPSSCLRHVHRGMPDIKFLPTRGGTRVATMMRRARVVTDITLIFCHGSGSDLGLEAPYVRHFEIALSVNVVALDYSGYGQSQGRASEEQLHADVLTVYEALTRGGFFFERPIDPGKIAVYGQSLGTAVTLRLAAHVPLLAIILESPLLSVHATHPRLLCCCRGADLFNARPLLAQVHCPVLVLHGAKDSTVPVSHAHELRAALPRPPTTIVAEHAGHQDLRQVLGDALYFGSMRDFLIAALAERRATAQERKGAADAPPKPQPPASGPLDVDVPLQVDDVALDDARAAAAIVAARDEAAASPVSAAGAEARGSASARRPSSEDVAKERERRRSESDLSRRLH